MTRIQLLELHICIHMSHIFLERSQSFSNYHWWFFVFAGTRRFFMAQNSNVFRFFHSGSLELKWVCLKIGYIPNYSHLIGIRISKTIGFRGLAYFQTHPNEIWPPECRMVWHGKRPLSFRRSFLPSAPRRVDPNPPSSAPWFPWATPGGHLAEDFAKKNGSNTVISRPKCLNMSLF